MEALEQRLQQQVAAEQKQPRCWVMGCQQQCNEQDHLCALHTRYAKMREELKSIFQSETIEKLVNDIRKGKQKINI